MSFLWQNWVIINSPSRREKLIAANQTIRWQKQAKKQNRREQRQQKHQPKRHMSDAVRLYRAIRAIWSNYTLICERRISSPWPCWLRAFSAVRVVNSRRLRCCAIRLQERKLGRTFSPFCQKQKYRGRGWIYALRDDVSISFKHRTINVDDW